MLARCSTFNGEFGAYQNADLLVRILARDAVGGEFHQDGLRGHCKVLYQHCKTETGSLVMTH